MTHPKHILLIDNNANDLELALHQLRQGLPGARLDTAASRGDFESALKRGGFDLAITDYWLEWDDGLSIFHKIRRRFPDCPVIMLTGTGNEEVAVDAMMAGFDDYVLKGKKGYDRLSVRVRAAMETARTRRVLRDTRAALQESRDRLDGVLNSLDHAVWSVSPGNKKLLFLNAAVEKIYGVPHQRFAENAMLWLEMVHPDDRERVLDFSREIEHSGEAREVEFRIVRPDGEIRWAHNRGRMTPDSQGRPLRMEGIITDISERKAAHKRADDLQRIIEQSAVAVLITGRDGNIEYANPKFTQISGYALDEVLGKNPRLLKSGTTPPEIYREMWKAISAGREWHGTLQNRRKDGEPYWESDTIFSIKGEDGAISHFIAIQEDISERIKYEERLAHQASHDELTNLPNRTLFHDRLEQALAGARQSGELVAVAFLDLDGFNVVNDSLGHEAGDALLVAVAGRLRGCVRDGDMVARIGGDVFSLLLPNAESPENTGAIAERARLAVAEPLTIAGKEVFITCSIGLSLFTGDGEDGATLLRNADTAMCRAKENGRNNFQFYAAEMSEKSRRRLAVESELRHALERGELVLYYQPIVDLHNGEVTGTEALIRWNHPEKGLVPPLDFIPLAEETGLIVPIGDWVIRTACAQNRAWQEAGLGELSVAVNVSARQFERHDVEQAVAAALRETGLAARHLKLELTETMLMRQPEHSATVLKQIKPSGVKLSLDDFGTGYSSLNYLKRFPFDYVKIDQSFIRHVTSDPHAAAIARTVVTLAHDLGLKVIAEGVETLEQMVYLRNRFCDEMQGFYFSRPLPAGEFEQLLRDGRKLPVRELDRRAPRTLLLVDDEANILSALQRVLRRDGYQILHTTSPQEAFDLLAAHQVGVILSDQRMPEMSGVEFLRRVKHIYPDTIRIVLSGYAELKSVTAAINEGAVYKFLTKPWEDEQLRANVREAFEHYDMAQENARLAREISQAYEAMWGAGTEPRKND